jgi:DNA-binding transcriptional ArsR family regulator
MTKVTLELKDFKALASETRLDILRALDGKKLSLKEISTATNLHEVTIHEHISKLVEAEFVKKEEREGHKWVYYKLSWKGASLIHPENTRVVVLFSSTIVTLFLCMIGIINIIQTPLVAMAPSHDKYGESYSSQPALFPYITLGCLILFTVLLSISLWRWRKNKTPKL